MKKMSREQLQKNTRATARRAIRKVAAAADSVLMRVGKAARKRHRARRARSALRTAGKVALVLGAGAATAYAGKTVLARASGRNRGNRRKRR